MLPHAVSDRLKRAPGVIADAHDCVTVLFADIVDFTGHASSTAPEALVALLNELFSRFDELSARHGLEKIKTIGDCYMAVAGAPEPCADHAERAAAMALAMLAVVRESPALRGVQLRVGLHSGPVVAGVIGTRKLSYDLWGDTVNVASRMESHGVPNAIQVTEAIFAKMRDRYNFESRGQVEVKGKGKMDTWLLWKPASVSTASVRGVS